MVQECFQTGVMAMAIFFGVVIVGCLRAPRNETGLLSLEGVFFFSSSISYSGESSCSAVYFWRFPGVIVGRVEDSPVHTGMTLWVPPTS